MIRRFVNLSMGILLVGMFFASCVPQKKLLYFQNKDTAITNFQVDTSYLATIHPNDVLTIYVASISQDASQYFGATQTTDPNANIYIVNHFGDIQLPLVGNVHVADLTISLARDTVIKALSKYLISPSVRLNFQNFHVTVLGEVMKPGVYAVQNEKITLPEALALAGDLTPFAQRDNIMVIREMNNKKEFGLVDITRRTCFMSSYYNLHANDIVFVEAGVRKQLFTDNYFKVFSWLIAPLTAIVLAYKIASF